MKNNPTRILPQKRTVGSIVRRVQPKVKQPTNDNNSPQKPTTDSAKTTSKTFPSNSSNADPVCDICAQNVPGPEREMIYAYGKCDHHVCYVCSARLRAICDQQECPICREKLDHVVFCANKTKLFASFDLKSLIYDDKHKIYFEDEKIRSTFEKLLLIECIECRKRSERIAVETSKDDDKKQTTDTDTNSTRAVLEPPRGPGASSLNQERRFKKEFKDVERLKVHLATAHKLKLCDLCLTHNKLFPFEYSYYDNESLRSHTLRGEKNTSHKGHPRCELCDATLFNLDELLQHMSRDHFHCHLCGRHNTTQHIYFSDYPSLRKHFKTKHFLCERDNCRHEQWTSAFDTQVDYQLHLMQVHETSSNLSRGEARQQRTVLLETAPLRQNLSTREDRLPPGAAIVNTGSLATANDPQRRIPESIQAQIRQQRLPTRSEFPALGNSHNRPGASSQNVTQQVPSSQNQPASVNTNLRVVAGPSNSRISFVRSIGGHGRAPDQLNEMDFPPLPEQPKKTKTNTKVKGTSNPRTSTRPEEMTLDQLISASLSMSPRNNRSNARSNKSNKNTKQRPIKIQL